MASFQDTSLPDELRVLMHVVLDGEASPAQAAELEQKLARDASARAEFDRLKQMFETLDRVVPAAPPAGLADLVVAQAQMPGQEFSAARQLPLGSRVIESQVAKSATSTPLGRIFNTVASLGAWIMSEQNGNTSSNRKLWIGGGVAAAAAALVAAFTMGAPKVDDTSGTIAPAKRYRADQPSAADVNVERPRGTNNLSAPPPPPEAGGRAGGGAKADGGGAARADGGGAARADGGGAARADGGGAARADGGGAARADGGGAARADGGGAARADGGGAARADGGGAARADGGGAARADGGGAARADGGGAARANGNANRADAVAR